MTEAEWLASDDPDDLLEFVCQRRRMELGMPAEADADEWVKFLHGGVSVLVYPRKRRLFACACCRRIWPLLPQPARNAVAVGERLADGAADDAERLAARANVETAGQAVRRRSATRHALKAAAAAVMAFANSPQGFESFGSNFGSFLNDDDEDGGFTRAANAALHALVEATAPQGMEPLLRMWNRLRPEYVAKAGQPVAGARWYAELVAQCDLIRDIFDNPFRPAPFDPAWRSTTVASIAEAIYTDRAFDRMPILADALEDAGCTSREILDHCRSLGEHVRGCWVVDLVLGKD